MVGLVVLVEVVVILLDSCGGGDSAGGSVCIGQKIKLKCIFFNG